MRIKREFFIYSSSFLFLIVGAITFKKCLSGNSKQFVYINGQKFDPKFEKGDKVFSNDLNQYRIFQFNEKLNAAELKEIIQSLKIDFSKYVDNNTYISKVNLDSLSTIEDIKELRATSIYQPKRKFNKNDLKSLDGSTAIKFAVELFPDADTSKVYIQLLKLKIEKLRTIILPEYNLYRIILNISSIEEIESLSEIPEVFSIEPISRFKALNKRTSKYIRTGSFNSLDTSSDHLQGQNQILGHLDTGIDVDHCSIKGRVDLVFGRDNDNRDQVHGTSTAASAVGGNSDAQGKGIASEARLVHANFEDMYDFDFSLIELLNVLSNNGAKVHNNSYADTNRNIYNYFSRDIDNYTYINQSEVLLFASNDNLPGSAVNSKNAITVNASDTNGAGCRFGVLGYSLDQRVKPELIAPGVAVTSGLSNSTTSNCTYHTFNGASNAVGFISGASLLIREHFESKLGMKFISGNLIKACLIHGANSISPGNGFPSPPSTGFGYGRFVLNNIVNPKEQIYFIQKLHNEGLNILESVKVFEFETIASIADLKITLVWNDPPSLNSENQNSLLINNINLEVIDLNDNSNFYGNVFNQNSEYSEEVDVQNSSFDALNNVEIIKLEKPDPGKFLIKVSRDINKFSPTLDQGFALIVSGSISDAGIVEINS